MNLPCMLFNKKFIKTMDYIDLLDKGSDEFTKWKRSER